LVIGISSGQWSVVSFPLSGSVVGEENSWSLLTTVH
jgi:hypothetical protein